MKMTVRKLLSFTFLSVLSCGILLGQEFVRDEVLVKFKPGTPRAVVDQISANVGGAVIETTSGDSDLYRVKLQRGISVEQAIELYSGNTANVLYSEKNLYLYPMETIPNDPQFSVQWALKNTGDSGGTPGADIRATFAWDVQRGDPNVVIAVIDTGVDYNHPDLRNNIWSNPGEICGNGIDDDGNGKIDDCRGWNFVIETPDPMDDGSGHGTLVSGIIAATGNNSTGVSGVMWRAQIMPLKIQTLDPATSFDSIEAIDYAKNEGAKIINISMGCRVNIGGVLTDIFLCDSTSLRDAIERADDAGVLVVAAAGNSNRSVDGGFFEETNCASDDANKPCNVIGVAATNRNDNKLTDSNYGPKTIHIAAPGEQIRSTGLLGGYTDLWNTSASAPHVAGVAGLTWSQNPSYNHKLIKDSLLLSYRQLSAFNSKTISEGIVNAQDAILSFGDQFADTASGLRFFSQGGTGQRWGVAQNGSSRCDLFVRTFAPADQVSEAQFFDRAGDPGSNWTLASYKASYAPGGQPQTVKLRITTTDGSNFSGKKGRIGVGFIGQTGLTNPTCASTGLTYGEHSFTAAFVGGLQLDDAVPFWYANPPYTEQTYPAIGISTLTELTISITFRTGDFTMSILNSDTGAQLFSVTSGYPAGWTWSGTHAPVFAYYGIADGTSGAIYVRDFVSTRLGSSRGDIFPDF